MVTHKKQGGHWSRRGVLASGLATIAAPTWGAGALSHTEIAAMIQRAPTGDNAGLQVLLPEGSGANVAPVVTEFKRLTGIDVHLNEVPVDDVNIQLILDNLNGTHSYDVALPATFGLPDLVEDGVILPLTQMGLYDDLSDTQARSLFTVGDTFDGETYGFQTDGDAYMMFYHNDFLTADGAAARYADRFGVALELPQTWADLDRQMAWFHNPDEGKFGGVLFRNPGYVAWEWWVRFHARGSWPLSPDMTPQLATDAGVGALEDMIRATQYLAPEAANAGLFENWARYSRGDVYANVGWGGSQKFFNKPGSPLRGKLRYGKTPGGLINDQLLVTPYFNWGWNYVAVAGTQKPDLALLFAAFATSPEMSTLSVRQQDGFFDPYRLEHYDDPGIQAAYSKEFLTVHRDSMENAIPDLYLARQQEYFLALSNWINRALDGSVTPRKALERVTQQWNLITLDVGRSKQTERWLDLRSKYPEQARRLLSDV